MLKTLPWPVQEGVGRAACLLTIILVHISVTKSNHWYLTYCLKGNYTLFLACSRIYPGFRGDVSVREVCKIWKGVKIGFLTEKKLYYKQQKFLQNTNFYHFTVFNYFGSVLLSAHPICRIWKLEAFWYICVDHLWR